MKTEEYRKIDIDDQQNILHIRELEYDLAKRTYYLGEIQALYIILSIFLYNPIIVVVLNLIIRIPFIINIVLYAILCIVIFKLVSKWDQKTRQKAFTEENYVINHKFAFENTEDLDDPLVVNPDDPIINAAVLMFPEDTTRDEYLKTGEKITLDGTFLPEMRYATKEDDIKFSLDFYIGIFIGESGKIYPIMELDEYLQYEIERYGTTDPKTFRGKVWTHLYTIFEIIQSIREELIKFPEVKEKMVDGTIPDNPELYDLVCDAGHIIFKKDTRGDGIILNRNGEEPIFYDVFSGVKIPVTQVSRAYERTMREGGAF